ncbi:MAG: UDP-glucuronic acid decarboxylase family protein [Methanomassiliicoccales archaeon]
MPKILVTGGAGFIGSHLCDHLLKRGNEVIAVDNLYTGSINNIAHLAGNDAFEFIRHDIIDPLSVEVDQIFNLACPASPVHYQKDRIYTLKMGTVAMINMLDLAEKTGARIFQASTSEVYGDPMQHPQRETYWGNVNPIGPRSCYDEGKRVAESLLFAFNESRGVDIRVARIFNTYGPRMAEDDGRVVSNFIVQALKGDDITIYGNGLQTRSFCFIDDLVRGIHALMNKDGITGPVNLGNPDEFSILELAEKVKELTGSTSRIRFEPLPKDDPCRRRPDISLARELLSWEPQIRLNQGLALTVAYFQGRPS